MKLILVLCVVAPLVAFAHVLPDESRSDTDPNDISKCIRDSLENIYAENPDLDWWFKDAQVTVQILLKKGLNCKEIDNPFGVLKCMIKVVFSVILEIKRLIEALPKDKRHVVVDMVKAIRECFQN